MLCCACALVVATADLAVSWLAVVQQTTAFPSGAVFARPRGARAGRDTTVVGAAELAASRPWLERTTAGFRHIAMSGR